MSKAHAIIMQIFMTLIMAFSMSGVMVAIAMGGFSMERLNRWLLTALIAWPIAFILTQFAFPIANKMAGLVLAKSSKPAATESTTAISTV